ncbi:hypothetical protein [Microbacterium trichothecenolyticum]|uniref:Uncharacterized protein n=1 Tax=Microbacterium trichothecenolyticum TaxID=69370 RepID=A0ABU0TX53_MICTR|nr:hypothetical protein [Microbacterium trichothecenolyticum]MDQ1124240.1 hypothetical protein [Microbacterium trichothecenolyticum]
MTGRAETATAMVAVSGSPALRLRGLSADAGSEPLDIDVAVGELCFLPVDAAEGAAILRVLAGHAAAVQGRAITPAGSVDVSVPGHVAVLTLSELEEAAAAGSSPTRIVGLIDPLRVAGADPAAEGRARDLLVFLTAVEGRTIVASGRAPADDDTCQILVVTSASEKADTGH